MLLHINRLHCKHNLYIALGNQKACHLLIEIFNFPWWSGTIIELSPRYAYMCVQVHDKGFQLLQDILIIKGRGRKKNNQNRHRFQAIIGSMQLMLVGFKLVLMRFLPAYDIHPFLTLCSMDFKIQHYMWRQLYRDYLTSLHNQISKAPVINPQIDDRQTDRFPDGSTGSTYFVEPWLIHQLFSESHACDDDTELSVHTWSTIYMALFFI